VVALLLFDTDQQPHMCGPEKISLKTLAQTQLTPRDLKDLTSVAAKTDRTSKKALDESYYTTLTVGHVSTAKMLVPLTASGEPGS
jgi:hypothetical protein